MLSDEAINREAELAWLSAAVDAVFIVLKRRVDRRGGEPLIKLSPQRPRTP
ncbi:hypothetical protein ACWGLE_15900 [Streptomyces sp. NPDC055897]